MKKITSILVSLFLFLGVLSAQDSVYVHVTTNSVEGYFAKPTKKKFPHPHPDGMPLAHITEYLFVQNNKILCYITYFKYLGAKGFNFYSILVLDKTVSDVESEGKIPLIEISTQKVGDGVDISKIAWNSKGEIVMTTLSKKSLKDGTYTMEKGEEVIPVR